MGANAHRRVTALLADPDCRLSSTARHVLREMADYATAACRAWPSKATLAQRCGRSPATVWRALVELVELGAVDVEPRPGKSAVYRIRGDDPGISVVHNPSRPRDGSGVATHRVDATDPSRGRDGPIASTRRDTREPRSNRAATSVDDDGPAGPWPPPGPSAPPWIALGLTAGEWAARSRHPSWQPDA